jgi:hypothetical protein
MWLEGIQMASSGQPLIPGTRVRRLANDKRGTITNRSYAGDWYGVEWDGEEMEGLVGGVEIERLDVVSLLGEAGKTDA